MSSNVERALSAVKWSYAGVLARAASQLVANIILARLLGPEAFGFFAITLLLVGPAKLISELGLGSALIQKKSVSDDDVHIAFTWLLGVGIVTAAAFYALSDYAAHFFESPSAAMFLRYTAVIFLLYPVTVIATSQLQRNLNLKALQIASVVSYLIGFLLIGVFCATIDMGSVSLIVAFVSQAVVECVLTYLLAKPNLRLAIGKIDSGMLRFATRAVPANLTSWVLDSVDNLLIGKLFGARSLGMYAVCFNLVRTPTGHLVTTLQNVLFSVSSRIQHDDSRVARTYVAVLCAVVTIAIPIFAAIGAIAETCVVAIYGNQWTGAGRLLAPLALAMPLHCVTAITGPILWGKGRVGLELRISLAMGVFMLITLLLLSAISLVAVVWGVFAVYLIRAIWMVATIASTCAISRRRILNAIMPGMMLGLFIGLSIFALDHRLAEVGIAASARLMLGICLALSETMLWMLFIGQRGLPDELNMLIGKLIANKPFLERCWARCGV
jgi:O-antigen/teichoic acid export membrane protein